MALRVLLAVDGSEHSRVVARRVGQLAREIPGARVTILHVVRPPRAEDGIDVPLDVMVRRAAEPILAAARAELGLAPGQVADEVGVAGDPADEILAIARADGYDLLALGSHGHSGWREALLGSVAHKVLNGAPCPVLLVR